MENVQLQKLPNDCLSLIFSHFTLKEAVGTCLVSKWWRHLWADVLYFNVIDLDSNHFLNGENTTQAIKRSGRERKSEFIERVNRFLQLINQVPQQLKIFKVQYDLGAKAASELDKWLSFAFDKGVEEIVVDLKQIDYRIKDVKKYITGGKIPFNHRNFR